ncbi:MAG TPA: glycosyl hydrolase, partial [Polyangia bacterium]
GGSGAGSGGAVSTGGTGGSGAGSGGAGGRGSGGAAGAASGGSSGGATGGTAGMGSGGGTGGRGASGGGAGQGSGGATGGTAGTMGSGGIGGAGGMASGCGIEPVTPNATQKTRKALCYLYQVYGNHILAGQEENNDDNAMNYIYSNTGKYPAIRAFDVNNSMAPSQCVAHERNNGLCVFGYHMGIVNGDGYQSAETKTDINLLLTEGSTYNQTFKTRLDNVARMVQTVQDADGVAIMRLFHEAAGTWFWWSMEGGAQYVRVYKYAFNYLTVTKGLKNMIWLLPYDGSPDASFYPGKSFVDLGGADTYAGDGNYDPENSLYKKCVAVFGSTMPIALHECGPIPDPAQLMSTGTKWLFFNVWTSPYYQSPSNSVSHLQSVYTSSYVITRDEMPVL